MVFLFKMKNIDVKIKTIYNKKQTLLKNWEFYIKRYAT